MSERRLKRRKVSAAVMDRAWTIYKLADAGPPELKRHPGESHAHEAMHAYLQEHWTELCCEVCGKRREDQKVYIWALGSLRQIRIAILCSGCDILRDPYLDYTHLSKSTAMWHGRVAP